MNDHFQSDLSSAVSDFQHLRRKADMERLLAALRGESVDLLSFEEVRQLLRATATANRQLREIPLAAIVGSVGRYHDFTRSFLPRHDSDQARWTQVLLASHSLAGLPPIEVYQIDEAYFVVDGNHRVSVARQHGATTIQAYVIPFRVRVPLTPEVRPDELIIRAELAEFLEETDLDELRPGLDLRTTAPGQYRALREHIDVHRYYLSRERPEVSLGEAAAHWYDTVYLPIARVIDERGMLRGFPNRTITDLYLWLAEHRAELEAQLGWAISPRQAADDLLNRSGPSRAARTGEQILELAVPDELEHGPAPGQWRRERPLSRDEWLFQEILVPINGEPNGWEGLSQAISIAQVEGARLLGLHVVRSRAERVSPAAQALQAEFERRCAEAGVVGRLAVESGTVRRCIRDRSRWADLLVLQINYPTRPSPLARLTSGLRTLIRTSIRPVLLVPRAVPTVERLLLAYDASPKAEEALLLATYLAGRWRRELTVLAVADGSHDTAPALARARAYLTSHGVHATYVAESGPAAPAILSVAAGSGSGAILMGGYGRGAISDLMLGSVVEEVLRARQLPTVICQ